MGVLRGYTSVDVGLEHAVEVIAHDDGDDHDAEVIDGVENHSWNQRFSLVRESAAHHGDGREGKNTDESLWVDSSKHKT